MNVGINHVPAYQASGRPFASGSILSSSSAHKVEFPYVTRWVHIVNRGGSDIKVGFSEAGVRADADWTATRSMEAGTYFFTLPTSGSTVNLPSRAVNSIRMETKVSQIWLSASVETDSLYKVDVIAGLTTIPIQRTSGSKGPNFSGSVGVG
jgi:hypothetical protein